MRRTLVRALAVVVAVAVLAAGGLFVYARFLAPEPAPALSLPEGRETGGTAVTHPSLSDGSPRSDLDGVWRVAPGSEAGYRVDEVLSGQNVTVVGRTEEVTGYAEVVGGELVAAEVVADLASVATGTAARDSFYRDRLEVHEHPQAVFRLDDRVPLGGLSRAVSAGEVRGVVTVRGIDREVVADVRAVLRDGQVQVVGTIPVTFEDFGITAPNLGFVTVEPSGLLELLLLLSR